jgi:hypothetical protein
MELWTEYEGRTIDGVFPLKKLLLPQGRSAFFSTSNGSGMPTVIRLIASHFDEEEILTRWRGVEALGHPNILKIEQYGQMVLDDTTVVYAVFEPVDANLAEVIAGQQLAVDEARQLAVSLASALEVLHNHGFVHEHVEPANVFAVGEVVKLRGDCIRETPEGEGGLDAKRRDVHDLALVLLRALTPAETLEAATRVRPLPIPFDGIVRNGLNGTWGLTEILSALGGAGTPLGKPGTVAAGTTTAGSATAGSAAAVPAGPAAGVAGVPTAVPAVAAADTLVARREAGRSPEAAAGTETVAGRGVAVGAESSETRTTRGGFVPPGARPLVDDEDEREGLPSGHRVKWMAAVGLGTLLLIWLIWHGVHGKSASQNAALQASSPANSAAIAAGEASEAPSVQPGSGSVTKPAAAGPSAGPRAGAGSGPRTGSGVGGRSSTGQGNSATAGGKQWRVVAFTYNRADQAQKKVASIAQKHRDLRPEVFSPTGRAPYLVTLGGVMGREQAFAFAERARRAGLPRDTYAQNYDHKGR